MKSFSKKTAIIILLVLFTLSILAISSTKAEQTPDFQKGYFYDGSGIFRVRFSGNDVDVREVYPDSRGDSYTLDESVVDCCVAGGRTYALTKSQYNRKQAFVYRLAEGKVARVVINNIALSDNNAEIAVDSGNRYYIIDSESIIRAFDESGKALGTVDGRYYGLAVCGGRALAVNGDGVFSLNKTKAARINAVPRSYSIKAVSETEYTDGSGTVYSIYGDATALPHSIVACLNDYYITYDGNALIAYDRKSLETVSELEIQSEPAAIFGFGNRLVVISGDLGVTTFKASNFEKKASPTSAPTGEKSAGLSFGQYKVSGKYIYVPAGMKRSTFKSEISYEGYELTFDGKRTIHIGTGTKLQLTKGSKIKEYIFIAEGDTNGTGEVNKTDLNIIFDHLLKVEKLKGIYKKAADINRDGKITNSDLVLTDRLRQ